VTAAALPERRERVAAWGGTVAVESWVVRPTAVEEVVAAFELARARGLTVGVRGAGQSYGDAALNGDGICLDLSRMNRILAWDPARGVARVEPGVTIGQLWQRTIADGWWPAVVPGTMHATLGGCAAMNVHGKNNWKAGTIGEHVLEVELLLPGGEVRRCSRDENAELFHAAIGGFGMLGCFLSLTVGLHRVHSGLLDVEPLAGGSLDGLLAIFEERMAAADYLVGWVDGFARGGALGRGLVHQGSHLPAGEDPAPERTLRVDAQALPPRLAGIVPRGVMWRLMRPLVHPPGMRAVNAIKYRLGCWEAGRRYRQSHAQFAFLLDYVPNWKRAYGRGGLIQYQSFVPAAHAARVFRAQLERAQAAGLVPFLGVLKRHRPDPFLMTHAVDGYSLALDFQVTAANRARVWALAAALDPLVVEAGGRFYFAKDSTLTRASLARWRAEERVQRFLALKRACDPEERLQTDLYRRLLAVRPERGAHA
jgi:FAD/FMN-containing dehydrogenase